MTKEEIKEQEQKINSAIKAIESILCIKFRRVDRDDSWKIHYLFEFEGCGLDYIKLTQKQLFYLSNT